LESFPSNLILQIRKTTTTNKTRLLDIHGNGKIFFEFTKSIKVSQVQNQLKGFRGALA